MSPKREPKLARVIGVLATLFIAALAPRPAQAQDRVAAVAKKVLTLEAVFGAGGLQSTGSEPAIWSPDGTQLSYIHRKEDGSSELSTINIATGQRAVLVDADKLSAITSSNSQIEDAVERERRTRYGVTAYHWSPDSRHILFDANGDLHYYDLETGQSRNLQTSQLAIDTQFSPDGQNVSYVVNHGLFVRALRDNTDHALALNTADGPGASSAILNGEVDWLYEEELGVRSNYFWSPDSKQLAFLQTDLRKVPTHPVTDYLPMRPNTIMEKYPLVGDPLPVVRLGIVAHTGGRVRWIELDTTDAYVPRFGWVDSRTLFAIVLDRKQERVDLYFVDVKSGRAKCVLSETSDAYIDVQNHLVFRPLHSGNRFLWMSWRDGFTHIYLYSFDREHPLATAAKLERQLTHGNFEVTAIAGVNEDTGTVFYAANKEDDRQQDVYGAALDGSSVRQLTSDTGHNTAIFNEQGTAYMKTYSRIDRPLETSVCRVNSDCTVTDPASTAPDSYYLHPPEWLDFTAEDGTVLHGMLFLPSHGTGKVPVVLAPYGGPGGQMVQNVWQNLNFFDMVLANNGIAVLVVDNRGSANRGKKFASVPRFRLGEIELQDQLAALDQALAHFPQLDPTRVGFWGWSYGGFMTLYAMTHSGRFVAGCAGSPVSDWRLYDATYVERYMGLLPERTDDYEKYSVLRHAGELRGQLLMTHGLSDVNVHPQNTIKMADELIRAGISFEMMTYPRQTHHFTDEAVIHVFRKFLEHFVTYLRPSVDLDEASKL
jgi:dipeptidyl-peptidase 4